MRVLSLTCCWLMSAVFTLTLVSATGCATDAEGVDDCRAIEQARCEAAQACGLVSDVPACQRFYRDQCLHGLPVAPPGSVKLNECVATIHAAGVCATQSPDGVATALDDCEQHVTVGAPGVATACDLVREPEKSAECSFLIPGADAGVGGASHSGGGGNSSEDAGAGGGSGADGS